MTYQANITKVEINELPLLTFEGEVVIVDTLEIARKLSPELIIENLWGIDTETKPCFTKGKANQNKTALIQLCGASKCYLFRINKIGIPEVLLNIFSNPKVIKVGVALRDDIAGLRHIQDFKPEGFVDLQSKVDDYGIEAKGLRSISAIVLGVRISKTQQLSNWETEVYNQKQILYAATDAWMPREIFLNLKNSNLET